MSDQEKKGFFSRLKSGFISEKKTEIVEIPKEPDNKSQFFSPV